MRCALPIWIRNGRRDGSFRAGIGPGRPGAYGARGAIFLAAVMLVGCAATPPDGVRAVDAELSRRTGESLPGGPIASAVEAQLAQPLTPDVAARVALMNNRRVRATIASLHVAESDVVRAGLLSNPAFDVDAKFLEAGGGTIVEAAVSQNLLDVFLVPLRRRLAAAEFEVAWREILLSLLDVVRDARAALIESQAAAEQSTLRRSIVEMSTLRAEFAHRVRAAGSLTDLDVALIDADVEQARLDASIARGAELAARERANVALGFFGPRADAWRAAPLVDRPGEAGAFDAFEADVVRASVELDRDRAALAAGATSLAFRRTFAWGDELHVGAAGEREPDGKWAVGPAVGGTIPLWDFGGTRVARARATLEQARESYYARAVEVRAAARSARDQLALARSQVERLNATVVPLQRQITKLSLLQYNAMQIDAMALLNVRRTELQLLSQAIDARRRCALAEAEVQHLRAGGRATMAMAMAMPVVPGETSSTGASH